MVIPVIASFAAAGSAIAAAGGIVAAMSTFTGFLAVAGAALTGIGAITGKKDLVKIGSLMTLGSSLASAASSASSTAASEVAAEQAAQEGFRAAEYSDMAAYNGGNAAASSGSVTPTTAGMEQATEGAANAGVSESAIDPLERANAAAAEEGASIFERASAASSGSTPAAAGSTGAAEGSSILDKLTAAQEPGSTVLGDINRQALQIGVEPSAAVPSGVTINGQVMTTDPIAQYASQTPASTINASNAASAQRSASMLDNVGQWVKNNKELAQLGGQLVTGLAQGYGQQQALDAQQSIYERRRRNLNNPVALTFGRA